MGITYGDHLIDSGFYDITPEQEKEMERECNCRNRGDCDGSCTHPAPIDGMTGAKIAARHADGPLAALADAIDAALKDRTRAAEAKVVEALLPEPAYWIVTWPGKSQGVHAAYGDIEEAKHAAKNIANYSTKKTETTIVPLYTVPASDLWKDRYESLLADAQRMEASIGARDE